MVLILATRNASLGLVVRLLGNSGLRGLRICSFPEFSGRTLILSVTVEDTNGTCSHSLASALLHTLSVVVTVVILCFDFLRQFLLYMRFKGI